MKAFGEIIRDARVKQNLTMRTLGENVGVGSGYISDIENGNRFPGTDKLKTLAKVLKLSYDSLVGVLETSKFKKREKIEENPMNMKVALARTIFNCEGLDEDKVKAIIQILNNEVA